MKRKFSVSVFGPENDQQLEYALNKVFGDQPNKHLIAIHPHPIIQGSYQIIIMEEIPESTKPAMERRQPKQIVIRERIEQDRCNAPEGANLVAEFADHPELKVGSGSDEISALGSLIFLNCQKSPLSDTLKIERK